MDLVRVTGFRIALYAAAAIGLVAVPQTSYADSLTDAFIAAYAGNPLLRAERARMRATDELVPQALSGWRPTINAQASVAHEWADTSQTKKHSISPKNLQISLSQPLFRGFKTVEATKVAEANIKAERAQLLAVEQNVLFSTVQAFVNVSRDRQILALRQTNVSFLRKQLQASQARFNAGELTRTDVAQSRSSLSGAQAAVAVASANVKASEANYKTVVGHSPGKLAAAHLAKSPGSLSRALAIAQEQSPSILAAAFVEEASMHNIEVIKGDLLPTVSLNAQASVTYDPQPNVGRSNQQIIQGVVAIPLYEGGRVYSAVRQAKHTASQNRILVINAVRTVRENVTTAWNNLQASKESLASVGQQVEASRLSLDGVRQEYLVGSRTTIDVLNAQQALLSVQITQVSAKYDQTSASYQLLGSMGQLTAKHLGLGNLYDATENYNNVSDKWFGLSADTVE